MVQEAHKILIDQFLTNKHEYYQISSHTFDSYGTNLTRFFEFLESRQKDALHPDAQDFLDYRKVLSKYRNATIQVYFAAISSFYCWASHPTVKRVEVNPMPPMKFESPSKHPNYIPTAQEFFKMRTCRAMNRLVKATAFELLGTSGMRVGELQQLRYCDINFTGNVLDYELQKKSPFIGGCIDLNPSHGLKIKRGRRRLAYFSKLTARLLKLYIEQNRLDVDDNCPLFPYRRQTIRVWLHSLGKGIVKSHGIPDNKSMNREHAFLDVDMDKLDIDTKIKRSVKQLQRKEEQRRADLPARKELTRIEKSKKACLHPHALRHFFAMSMYYRNWFGNRQDLITLRDLLGHSQVMMTAGYATAAQVVMSDNEWKRIYIGNGFDYANIALWES